MSLRSHLRQRDSRQLMLELLCSRHPGSEITEFIAGERYLQLLLQDEQGNRGHAWLNVDAWLEYMDAHLPDIPWLEVPLNYLARWLNHLQLSFLFEEQVWDVAQIALSANPLPEKALLLPAEPCPLLCLDWPKSEDNAQGVPAISSYRVPFRLQYVLGYSQLPLAQLADVAPGDLLLITQDFAHLAVGHRRLYKLSYHPNQEVIVEEQLAEHDQEYHEEEVLHEWMSLPVDIEFVLDGRTVTLAELEEITPGTALALTPDAEQNIKIYLNKKLFARGELVALENGSLAVEVNHVNPTLQGNRVQPDVE
ncbi:FliM/FliN family flagellar motor switch protein [Yersinia hibernica]|uniref:Type III secretion system protein n=1 Tax=Yersinia hibernica TaxID=2339259 RepID=A0ABX5R1H3_9GAMM|nr:FliM/FliN family flagellar motor switch protein [Yersinia hibernica]QAX79434.1 type III secretion system protein [Yersinia hibernica]